MTPQLSLTRRCLPHSVASRRAFLFFSFVQFFPLSLVSQQTQLGYSNSSPSFGHGHDYIQLLNETVNPADGSLTLKIDVPTPSGRGLNFPYAITYNSSIAHSFSQGTGPDRVPIFMTPAWAPNNASAAYPNGGWSDTLPKLVAEHIPYQEDDSMPPENDQQTTLIICESWQGFQFTDLSGQTHQPNLSVSYLYDQASGCNTPTPGTHPTGFDATIQGHVGTLSGAEFATNDGTYYEFPLDSQWQSGRVVIYPQLIEDKNGNKLSIVNGPNNSYGFIAGVASISPGVTLSVVDTLGRNVVNLQPVDGSHERLIVSGIPNPYIINFGPTPALTGIHTPQSSLILAGGPPLQTGNTMDTINAFPASQGPGTALTSLTLPDDGSYSFGYDTVFGNVNKITYPNGGYVSYTWGFPGGLSDDANYSGQYVTCADSGCNSAFYTMFRVYVQYAMPVILHREVSFDGSTVALTQDFSYQTTFRQGDMMSGWTAKTTTVTTHDLVAGTSSSVTYSYSPFTPYGQNPGQRYTGQQAQEYQTVYKDGSGNVLQTVCKTWIDTFDLMRTQKTILANGMVSEHDFDYTATGVSGAPTGGDDYDFSAPQSNSSCLSPYSPNFLSGAPAPGPLLRSTRQTSNTVANSPISLYPYAPSIIDTPGSTITKDGSGNIVAETDYQYTDAISQTVSGVLQHDPAFDNGSQVRQNLLSVTRQCSPSCASPKTTFSYDNTGQVVSATDALNNTTSYTYTDAYVSGAGQPASATNAYLTAVTRPSTNGIAHVQHFTFGYSDGKTRTATDENSKVTTYCYWTGGCAGSSYDPWMRLTQVLKPDRGSQIATYNDAGSSPQVVTTTALNSSSNIVQTTIGDGMGRPIQNQLNSDPSGTVYVDTVYNGAGQVYSNSNPYRSKSDPTYGVTYRAYDGLGRQTAMTEPDGSIQHWAYADPSTTFTDEDSNSWTRTVDGLGRLISVTEPGSLQTSYTYDFLGNLTNVLQAGNSDDTPRMRSFIYDSQSRLTSATNPEAGTINYAYDANSNLASKTSPLANAVSGTQTISYVYDQLNRLIQKGSPVLPAGTKYSYSCYQYDSTSIAGASSTGNFIGRLTNSWTQISTSPPSSFTCPSAPPTTALSRRSILAYDPDGRMLSEQQCTAASCGATPYNLIYVYDFAGNLVNHSNGLPNGTPGSFTFSNTYDGAGRLATVMNGSANLFTAGSPASSSGCTNSFSTPYSPAGGLANATFGTGLHVLRTYDQRLRMNCESDTGNAVPNPTPGAAAIVIKGTDQVQPH